MAELTVASFNSHWGVDMKGRPFDLVGTAVALDADVLVVQEAWHPHGVESAVEKIAAATGASLHEVDFMSDANPARPRWLTVPEGPPGTCGLALLSRLPVESAVPVALPRAQGDVVDQREAIVLTVRVEDRLVAVGGIHASHRLWGSLPQLRHLDRVLRATGHPTVIAGDCNMWGPPVMLAVRERERAVRGRTWPASHPHSQIDHILVDDRLEVLDARVGPAVGSDHRPVRARLRVR
jgi:endonuclease/exonuclease/phosphatase family metal-dependent hydrolase